MKRPVSFCLSSALLCFACFAQAMAVTPATDGMKLMIPEGYVEGQGLPTLSSAPADLVSLASPEHFNQSGVKKMENNHPRGKYHCYTMNDGAEFYVTDDGDLYYHEPGYTKSISKSGYPEGSTHILSLAGFLFLGSPDDLRERPALSKRSLACGSLEDAIARVESLAAHWGLPLTLAYALDMDAERLRKEGEIYNALLREGNPDTEQHDFSTVTAKDEHFYLVFGAEVNGVPVSLASYSIPNTSVSYRGLMLQAYVGADGVRSLILSLPCIPGEPHHENEALLTAKHALEIFRKENRDAKNGQCGGVLSMELMYIPIPGANQEDGLLLEPSWKISYVVTETGTAHRRFSQLLATTGEIVN